MKNCVRTKCIYTKKMSDKRMYEKETNIEKTDDKKIHIIKTDEKIGNKEQTVRDKTDKESPDSIKRVWRGELALLIAVVINSFGVVLMLYSGSGISAISSVPFAFSRVLPALTLGTWTYIFQGILVLSLMILRKRFVLQYLLSFVVGFVFGELIDVYELWIEILPDGIGFRICYFIISYMLICFGIALSNRCLLPIIPTDLFPRELSQITGIGYPKIKISFDVICLAVTAGMTLIFLGHLEGLGVGTVIAAFTMGKVIGLIGNWLDRRFRFETFQSRRLN